MSIIIRSTEYKEIKQLGKGGYGRVIQVKNKSNNKIYAIKEIKINNEISIENIKNEAIILSKFECNNIVKYYDSYLDKDKFYILMEYCDGQNLRDFINNNSKNNELIEENILYNIIKQICIGLKEIHDKNIIHRDIKPENIFMNEKNDIKIGDFGISKEFGPNKEFTITKKGAGSEKYMAPEIKVEGKYNKKSDMYSLGCIIYELFHLCKYYDDKEYNEIKKIDSSIYNNKWQEIINSLLQINYNKRMNINKVYDIILNEIDINKLENKINNLNINNKINNKNIIIGEIYIKKDDINKDIRIINSFENARRETGWILEEDEWNYENEKEIKENIVIKINEKIIEFTYYYKFKEEGKYAIEYLFKNNLKKTDYMFWNCRSLTNLNLSNFNTQNVTNMSNMFNWCESLKNLNLSNFNNQNVTNMSCMFCNCKSLTNLNLSNFNTQKVTSMFQMFCNCKSLTNLNLSNFNTKNVTDMMNMFHGCKSLTNLNLSNFNTQNVTNMIEMFYHCESLTNLNLSSFKTQNVTTMFQMFSHCELLTYLNLSNFNTQNVTEMSDMFDGCNSLKKNNIITKDNKILDKLNK